MKRRHTHVVSGLAASALVLALMPLSASAGTTAGVAPGDGAASSARHDDLPHPLGDAQRKLREEAVDQLIKGETDVVSKHGSNVIEVKSDNAVSAKGRKRHKPKYVQYDVDREASVFTVLTDFGDQTKPAQGGSAGSAHNEIAEPDRDWDKGASDDDSTIWTDDFSRDHYQELMFAEVQESFRDFYLKQSNGRFSASGDVSDWVTVPDNEARYGHNPAEGDGTSEAEGYWSYIKDTAAAWYENQKAKGKSDAEIKDYVAQFDVWDHYDHDGDGDVNEPDGYIDHFQAIPLLTPAATNGGRGRRMT